MSAAKVVVIGASGNVGSAIVKNLSSRGHEVIGVARNASKIDTTLKGVTAIEGDASKPESFTSKIKSADVLISAIYFDVAPASIISIAKSIGAKRLISVGGAGSLKVSPDGPYLVETPDFPAEYKELALSGLKYYQAISEIKDYNWLVVAPAALIDAEPVTGKYRIAEKVLLTDAQGNSAISFSDYAIGFGDEIANSKYSQTLITFAH